MRPRGAFPRTARLLQRIEFDAVLKGSERVSGRALRLHYRSTAQAARLGLVVAKRVAGRAVDRNRIKRLARETFRRMADTLYGLDLVVVAKPDAVTFDRAALRAELERLFGRLAKLNAAARDGTIAR